MNLLNYPYILYMSYQSGEKTGKRLQPTIQLLVTIKLTHFSRLKNTNIRKIIFKWNSGNKLQTCIFSCDMNSDDIEISQTDLISPCDNKSASHCIMFDYFFHVWLVSIFSFYLCFWSILAHMCKVLWKKDRNNDTLTHICLLPLFQMASYYVT